MISIYYCCMHSINIITIYKVYCCFFRVVQKKRHILKIFSAKSFHFWVQSILGVGNHEKNKKIHLWKFLFKCSVYAETFRNKNSKISLLHAGKLKIFWTLLIYYITNAFAIVSDFGFVNLERIAVSFTSTSNIFQFGRYIQIYLLVSIHWHFY